MWKSFLLNAPHSSSVGGGNAPKAGLSTAKKIRRRSYKLSAFVVSRREKLLGSFT